MIRNLFIAALLVSGLYAAATVPLGQRTLTEHIKAIGGTQEAKDLVDGTKTKLGPTVSKIKDTVVGEVKQSMGKMQKELLEQARQAKEALPSAPSPQVQAR